MPLWLHPVYYYLWVAPHILLGILLWYLLRRGLHKHYPIFLTYVVFELLQFGVLLGLNRVYSLSADQYRHVFIAGMAISVILRFGTIYEISTNILLEYPALDSLVRQALRWTAAGLLLLGAVLAKVSGSSPAFLAPFWILDRTVSLLQCGLLLLLLVFTRYFGLSWRNYGFGIALGFGVYESLELANAAIRAGISGEFYLLDSFGMAAYHLAVLIWLVWLFVPARDLKPVVSAAHGQDLEDWDRELRRLRP